MEHAQSSWMARDNKKKEEKVGIVVEKLDYPPSQEGKEKMGKKAKIKDKVKTARAGQIPSAPVESQKKVEKS